MRVTKHEHACLRLERDGKTLIIDPGSFTLPLTDVRDLVAIVLTHEHPDHWTPDHLDRLLADAPGTPILAPQGVAAAAPGYDITVVSPGDTVTVEPFRLTFHGGRHAVIHESIPVIDNVGVMVDDEFYYPGDSYAVPKGADVRLLAAPVGAPWLKIGEAMDFVLAVKPHRAFGTHDMTLSRIGLQMGRARLQWATEQGGGEFLELDPGGTADL
ncbi:MBL fold metallo-hydrolase [Microbacterium sp. zg.Y1090]|uniref:MBL fold metallo-hydrolase n=1 Tax=Microbacterium TaxID=33882 RepID=UPI00214AE391|nr:MULTISPECIES: MBL fold metallo-hydrolase [unclassified Microbacterium]MCR2811603.1 MBL fold metallo-hydrolase [Microbacterium sp. zg.Y1084]MCR2818975.1 MBL fold metallo-hydrolase [Microbacterium sp. zg.Y1090]MDL5487625.1 MBL fold metallo-hydrolase [Microbacterium sp. zg-Y1211]WIM27280.1 MBL fold metallo-hydrolase [Microbacterium sp. zg-Y1090]